MLIFKKISFWLALAGIVAASMLILRLQATVNQPVPPPPIMPAAKPFPNCLGAAGLVEALHENTNVGTPVPGLVASVAVNVWDKVEAGAVLFTLDSRDLQAALPVQEAQIQVATATLTRLRDQLARLEAVSDLRAISSEELQLRRSDIAVAEAQLKAAQAARAQTAALIERLTIRAPIAGTILQLNTRAGEYLTPSNPNAAIILGQIDQLQVRADIDEQLAPRMHPGARAVANVKGNAANPIPLEFVRIEPYIVPKRSLTGASIERVDTRVLQVIFRFANPQDGRVYVGQQMDIYIEETK